MSVEIVLVPIALAAISAWQASRAERDESGRVVCQVATRMRDQGLLVEALEDTGAQVSLAEGIISAGWAGVAAQFSVDAEGVWTARLTGDVDEPRAVGIVQAVDQAYARQVQTIVLARLRERAPNAGMQIESERREQDDTVVLTLSVQTGGL